MKADKLEPESRHERKGQEKHKGYLELVIIETVMHDYKGAQGNSYTHVCKMHSKGEKKDKTVTYGIFFFFKSRL